MQEPSQPIQPSQLAAGVPRKVIGVVTQNTVLILGIVVIAVILGAILLAWFDKPLPESIIALAGVALGYLGKGVLDGNSGGTGG